MWNCPAPGVTASRCWRRCSRARGRRPSSARVLSQKCELGLLDPAWDPAPAQAGLDLAPAAAQELARRLAEESVGLLANDGILPLDPGQPGRRAAGFGPGADDPYAMLGCYSFPSHVGVKYPDSGLGVDIPTALAALRAEFPAAEIGYP